MNASEFANALAAVAPSEELLKSISPDIADVYRSGYTCIKKNAVEATVDADPILELIRNWDVSGVEVGMMSFVARPFPYQGRGIQVGLVEADPLVILNAGSELVVEEAGTAGHVLWKVARTSGQFLDALALAAKFFSDRTVGLVDFDDMASAMTAANMCAERAGGDAFADFYRMLFGVE